MKLELIVEILSLIGTVVSIYITLTVKKLVVKTAYYGSDIDEYLAKNKLNQEPVVYDKPYDGWRSRQFPSLKIEKLSKEEIKDKKHKLKVIHYYINEDNNNEKRERCWYLK